MSNKQDHDDFTAKGLVYDYYFHESDRISTRTDWFLIFHAILLEAFFSIKVHATKELIIVGALGIVSASIWWLNGLRAYRISWQLGNLLSDEIVMGELAEMNKRIFKQRRSGMDKRWYGWAKHVPLYAVVTPCLFIIAWELLLFFRISSGCPQFSSLMLVLALGSGTIGFVFLLKAVTRKIDATFKPTSDTSSN